MSATKSSDLDPFSLTITFPEDHTLSLIVHPNATIQDIKISISDSSDSLSYTCFDLVYNGKTCDPKCDLKSIDGLLQDLCLNLVPKMYNEHEIRVHLSRFREIMTFFETPSQMHGYEASGTIFPQIKETDSLSFQKIEQRKITELYCHKKTVLGSILKSIEMSGWNPPCFSRKMMGDLLYLKITTLEGKVWEVTASTEGFFLNDSTDLTFSPGKMGQVSYTLPDLLSKISPIFKEKYPILQSALLKREPYEFLMATYPVYPWLVSEQVLNYDFDHGRTLDSLLMASDVLDTLACRDWNEDIQSARELPKSTVQECVLRDQAISKAHSDFVEAAVRGAIGIVHESIPPVESSQSVYIHNNIFFSQINDYLEHFERYGGFDAAHVALGKDIDGIKIVSALDSPALYTVGGVVIDYKGTRTMAQTIVPGIIKKNGSNETSVIYGLSGADKKFVFDQEFHEELQKVREHLSLEEHCVFAGCDGMQSSIFTSLDAKGVMGSDSRKYLLDLYRMSALDIIFLESTQQDKFDAYPHELTLVRPELIEIYKDTKIREILKQRQAQLEGDDLTKIEIDLSKDIPHMTFNVDAFTKNAVDQSGEENVRQLSAFLNDVVINQLIIEFANIPTNIPIDGAQLTSTLHSNGVNMRYLGKLATRIEEANLKSLHYLKLLCEEEMIARACKHILRKIMASAAISQISLIISHFLNCFFSDKVTDICKELDVLSLKETALMDLKQFNSEYIKEKVISEVKRRFRYVITYEKLLVSPFNLLRSICLKVGIQLLAKDYDFTSQQIFESVDIVNIYPIVKHSEPRMNLADQIFQHGADLFRKATNVSELETPNTEESTQERELRDSNLKQGLELMKEAITILEQVRGPIHPHTARALSHLAVLIGKTDKLEDARFFQKKAVIAYERCFGSDDPGTLQQYVRLFNLLQMNMAQLEFNLGKELYGLELGYHALSRGLFLTSNRNHLDVAIHMTSLGTMCQKIQNMPLAIEFLSLALSQVETMFGPDHPMTISSVENLIRGLYLNSEFRMALKLAKRVLIVNEKRYGEKDSRSIESRNVLHTLTSRAVEQARHLKLKADN